MDRIQAMQVFTRVVETGSFTRAAEALGLPKGSVTKIVQQLEARLRVRLLNRTTRRVTVTHDGAVYYERTLRLLNDLDEIEASMANAVAKPSGRLRVDVGSSVARHLIIPALPAFHALYPDIQLDLGVTDRPVDLLVDSVDCVIRGGEILDQSLVARRIGNVRLVTVAAPGYLELHGTPGHPSELEHGHTVVNFFSARTGRLYPLLFEKDGQSVEVWARHKIAVNEANAHLDAVVTGLGISQVALFAAERHVARGELVRVLADWAGESIPVHVVYPPNRHVSAKVRAFVDWIADLFGRQPHLQG